MRGAGVGSRGAGDRARSSAQRAGVAVCSRGDRHVVSADQDDEWREGCRSSSTRGLFGLCQDCFHSANDHHGADAERPRELHNHLNRRALDAPLDETHVAPVNSGVRRQPLLGHALGLPELPEGLPERLPGAGNRLDLSRLIVPGQPFMVGQIPTKFCG